MRSRLAHTFLALLILVQSVSALAVISSVSDLSAPVFMNMDMSEQAVPALCHEGAAPSTTENPHNCCETMDAASCRLHCSSVATAITLLMAVESVVTHEHYGANSDYAAPRHAPAGLYRPPRIS